MSRFSFDDDGYMDYMDQERLVQQDLEREKELRKRKAENYRKAEEEKNE